MYNKVATDMNFTAREKQTAEMWKEKDIIRKSYHHRDGNERFTFLYPWATSWLDRAVPQRGQ